MAAAFTSIMNKKIVEDESDTPKPEAADVTLVKYKKKVRDLDDKLAKEDAENKKRLLKEQRRLMSRIMPTKADNEYERSL